MTGTRGSRPAIAFPKPEIAKVVPFRWVERTRRDARFSHMDLSMSDGTRTQLRYTPSKRSSRPNMRGTKRSFSASPFLRIRLAPQHGFHRARCRESNSSCKSTRGLLEKS